MVRYIAPYLVYEVVVGFHSGGGIVAGTEGVCQWEIGWWDAGERAGLLGADGLVDLSAGFEEGLDLGQGEHGGGIAKGLSGVGMGFDE